MVPSASGQDVPPHAYLLHMIHQHMITHPYRQALLQTVATIPQYQHYLSNTINLNDQLYPEVHFDLLYSTSPKANNSSYTNLSTSGYHFKPTLRWPACPNKLCPSCLCQLEDPAHFFQCSHPDCKLLLQMPQQQQLQEQCHRNTKSIMPT